MHRRDVASSIGRRLVRFLRRRRIARFVRALILVGRFSRVVILLAHLAFDELVRRARGLRGALSLGELIDLPAKFFRAPPPSHLISTDRLLREQFPQRFSGPAGPRMVLAAGALGGWLLAGVVSDRTVTLSLLSALLGGAILLNVLDQELPARHEVRIGWFVAGLVTTASLLTALAAAGERGAA